MSAFTHVDVDDDIAVSVPQQGSLSFLPRVLPLITTLTCLPSKENLFSFDSSCLSMISFVVVVVLVDSRLLTANKERMSIYT
jgi:hypothetical protein